MVRIPTTARWWSDIGILLELPDLEPSEARWPGFIATLIRRVASCMLQESGIFFVRIGAAVIETGLPGPDSIMLVGSSTKIVGQDRTP
jgi:hypothetical protein